MNKKLSLLLFGANLLSLALADDTPLLYEKIAAEAEACRHEAMQQTQQPSGNKNTLPPCPADIHAFTTLKEAQKYNSIVKKNFLRIRKQISWREFSAKAILEYTKREKIVTQFLDDAFPLLFMEGDNPGVPTLRPGGVWRVIYDDRHVYIAKNEWELLQDPSNSPYEHPLYWLYGSDMGVLLNSAAWAEKKHTTTVPIHGYRLPFKAELLGAFLTVKTLRASEEKSGKEKLQSLQNADNPRIAQKIISEMCLAAYDSQTQNLIRALARGKIKEAIDMPAEPLTLIPAGTRLRPLDNIVFTDFSRRYPAESILECTIRGKKFYISAVDYILRSLANDKPTSADKNK